MSETPLVSAVIPAYNHPRFLPLALDGVLAQEHERVEAIVVDDGSTDDTGAIADAYAARYPDRIRVVHQPNGGYNKAVNAGFAAARGKYAALLDADDEWLPEKLTRQVEILEADPAVVLVHSSQRLVDADGALIHRSWFEYSQSDPAHGRPYAELLCGNTVGASSIVFRTAALAPFLPIPPRMPYGDWYLAVAASLAGELACVPEPLSLYRWHGTNITLSDDPAVKLGEARKRLLFQRLIVGLNRPGLLGPNEVRAVVGHLDVTAKEICEAAGTFFTHLTDVSEDERAESLATATRAHSAAAAGDGDEAAALGLAAVALDPWSEAAREALAEALPLAVGAARFSYRRRPTPDPSRYDTRGFVTVAAGRDLIGDPALLREYATHFHAGDDATLVAAAERPEELGALQEVARASGLDGDAAPDVLLSLVPAERQWELGWSASAVLGSAFPAPWRRPRVGRGRVGELRTLLAAGR